MNTGPSSYFSCPPGITPYQKEKVTIVTPQLTTAVTAETDYTKWSVVCPDTGGCSPCNLFWMKNFTESDSGQTTTLSSFISHLQVRQFRYRDWTHIGQCEPYSSVYNESVKLLYHLRASECTLYNKSASPSIQPKPKGSQLNPQQNFSYLLAIVHISMVQ